MRAGRGLAKGAGGIRRRRQDKLTSGARKGEDGVEQGIPVTFELPQDVYEEAARIARYRGESVAEFVTESVRASVESIREEYAYPDWPLGPAPGWENRR